MKTPDIHISNPTTDADNATLLKAVGRRHFVKGLGAAGASLLSAGAWLASSAAAQEPDGESISEGDAAILRFLAAAELIEADLWIQYAELGGNSSDAPNAYQAAFSNLDGDGQQYITSNTLDEVSHAAFLNAYLESKGAEPVNFDKFRTLPGSTAKGSTGIGRLTNLMHLNVDTSWYVRYRSATNPDTGTTYPQAITIRDRASIPVTDADFEDADHIQVIANIAAFHFGAIEQGGTSLYATMSQKVMNKEVLKIVLGIGGSEVAHFLEWVDFAGNSVQPPVAPVTDQGLTFPDFISESNPLLQPNLIFPVPCEFISPDLPRVAIIRPLKDRFAGARAAVAGFTASGLFIGQSEQFLRKLNALAEAADMAHRG